MAFVLETGRPITEVPANSGINAGTMGSWVAVWHQNNPEPEKPFTPTERAKVTEMEGELRKLHFETDVLRNR